MQNPAKSPAPIDAIKDTITLPLNCKASPPTIAEKAKTEPTDKSIPPEKITKDSPAAIKAITADWRVISKRLLTVKKYGDSKERITHIMIRINSIDIDCC